MKFLYKKGDTYILHQQSPVPWLHSNDGEFAGMRLDGRDCKGKEYMDYAAKVARRAFFGNYSQSDNGFMWYLWCGKKSPLAGRIMKTFAAASVPVTGKNPCEKAFHSVLFIV